MEYVREEKGYYLIKPKMSEKEDYKEKMFLSGNIASLLEASVRHIDGESFYYYNIKSRQSLKMLVDVKKLDEAKLVMLLRGILSLISELEGFLLEPSQICFIPECIYYDHNDDSVKFCYYPSADITEETHGSMKSLAEFLIENINYEDERAVKLAYDYYEQVSNECLNIDSLLSKNIVEAEASNIELIPETGQDLREENESFYFREMEEEETSVDVKQFLPLIICAGIILLSGCVYVFLFTNTGLLQSLGIKQKDYIVFGAVLGLILVILILFIIELWTKKRKMESLEPTDPYKEQLEIDIVQHEAEIMEYDQGLKSMENETVIIKTSAVSEVKGEACLISKADKDKKLYINKEVFLLGKSELKVDGVISSPGVSRIHACIKCEKGVYYITDMNSTNGTRLNDNLLKSGESVRLANGDRIIFGDAEFVLMV